MGSLVGQTESNIRQALAIADAMAPSVLAIDELEKANEKLQSMMKTLKAEISDLKTGKQPAETQPQR